MSSIFLVSEELTKYGHTTARTQISHEVIKRKYCECGIGLRCYVAAVVIEK